VDYQYPVYGYKSNTGTGSTTIPTPDENYSTYNVSASASATLYNSSTNPVTVGIDVIIGGTVYGTGQATIVGGATSSVGAGSGEIYTDLSGATVSWNIYRISGIGSFSPVSTSAKGNLTQARIITQNTTNPNITAAGQTTQHTGTLTDGQVSDWVTANGLSKGVISLLHNQTADVQVEYTFEPFLPYTVLTLPEHSSSTTSTTVEYVFELTADA
jgi:hypothetical protein